MFAEILPILAPNSLILYVDDVDVSTHFYQDLLGKDPVAIYEGFAVFAVREGFTIGLQAKREIEPAAQVSFGGFEICLSSADRESVSELFEKWSQSGIEIVLKPTELEFGYTFVAIDPDGHRLRVCATDTTDLPRRGWGLSGAYRKKSVPAMALVKVFEALIRLCA